MEVFSPPPFPSSPSSPLAVGGAGRRGATASQSFAAGGGRGWLRSAGRRAPGAAVAVAGFGGRRSAVPRLLPLRRSGLRAGQLAFRFSWVAQSSVGVALRRGRSVAVGAVCRGTASG